MYYKTTHPSPIGRLTLASDGESLVGLWMEGQKYFAAGIPEAMAEKDELPLFDAVKSWLEQYFAGEQPAIDELPLAPIGSDFRQAVWKLLREIPYGTVTTYGAIAKQMAEKLGRKTMSAQAVGGAVGHNPISVIVPCHRVIGATGSLTGFSGGVETKRRLLAHEGVALSGLFAPESGTAL